MAELLRPKELLQMTSDAETAEMDKERALKQKKQQQDLDLREAFAGNYESYVQDDGLNPTDAGSLATAEVIWEKMASCVVP